MSLLREEFKKDEVSDLIVHAISGVLIVWLVTIILFFGALSWMFEIKGRVFLTMLISYVQIWWILAPAAIFGAQFGVWFETRKQDVPDDLKKLISRTVGVSMTIAAMFFGIVSLAHFL